LVPGDACDDLRNRGCRVSRIRKRSVCWP
jgi:hypothetical protein